MSCFQDSGSVTLRVADNDSNTNTGTASVTVEPALVCNDTPEGFEAGVPPLRWTVVNNVTGGREWINLSTCGPCANWTNGTGNAACLSAANVIVQPFDTELRTPVFDLTGSTDAYLNYQANYQNRASQEQLDLDISTDGGTTWTTLSSWLDDHGTPLGLPGEDVHVNMMAWRMSERAI